MFGLPHATHSGCSDSILPLHVNQKNLMMKWIWPQYVGYREIYKCIINTTIH